MKGRDAIGFLLIFFIGVFSPPLAGADHLQVDTYFQLLKELPNEKISDKGKVCERVAEIEIRQLYPSPTYEVASNIIYFNKRNLNIGELDLVVIKADTGKVVLVGEVKCWSNLATASRTARQQLARFRAKVRENNNKSGGAANLGGDNQILFISDDHHQRYFKASQFDGRVEFRLIGPKEPRAYQYGFVTLSLSLSELEALTVKIRQEHLRIKAKNEHRKAQGKLGESELKAKRELRARFAKLLAKLRLLRGGQRWRS